MVINQINISGHNNSLDFDNMTVIVNTKCVLSDNQIIKLIAFAQDMYESLLEETIDVTEEGTVINLKPIHKNFKI